MQERQKMAEQIRKNGQILLKEMNIIQNASTYGNLVFTGSFQLNLMVWNDIDMQILPHKKIDQKKAFTDLIYESLKREGCVKTTIMNLVNDYMPALPRGLYLGLEFDIERLGGHWKVDLWFLEPEEYEKNVLFMKRLEQVLDDDVRDLILKIKLLLKGSAERVPPLGSYELYQQILRGERSEEKICAHLAKKGFLPKITK